jgi:hypothetical protein
LKALGKLFLAKTKNKDLFLKKNKNEAKIKNKHKKAMKTWTKIM